MDLTGRRLVVFGTGSRLGHTLIDTMVARGGRVVGVDRMQSPVRLGASGQLRADLTSHSQTEEVITEAARLLGGIDAIICGTAVQLAGSVIATSLTDWRAVYEGTATTVFSVLHCGMPVLPRGGAVVLISSITADVAHPGNAAYAAAKGAVNALMRQVALEFAPRGVRVNAVAPGLVDGEPERSHGYPMGRTPSATEVANAVAFLASEDSSGITGITLPVDKGLRVASAAAMSRPAMRAQLGFDGDQEN